MILPIVQELSVFGLVDRGVPNQERIILRPTELVNLMQFVVTIALREEGGMVRPLNDHIFWFPELIVAPPSWILLYTGPGTPRETIISESNQPAYTLHWGKPNTILKDRKSVV